MKLRQLQRTHCDYDADTLRRYRDLFEGGRSLAKNVSKYIARNGQEPSDIYNRRCELARDEYVNYCGPIGNYFASWLMTSQLTFKSDPEDVDDFYVDFKENCDGDGTDLDHFVRCRFIDALINGVSYWRVEFPEEPPEELAPSALAEWRVSGLGRGVLVNVPADNITNWKMDRDGYVWVMEHTCDTSLADVDDENETTTETWTIWKRDGQHCRYQICYDRNHRPGRDDEIPEIEPPTTQGKILGIPLVELCLPQELWLMNLIAAPQMAHWRKKVGLSWAIDRTCYAMPVFNVKNRRKPPTMGAGYYLIQGIDEKAGYLAPPEGTYSVAEKFIADLKDEIHRVTHQMARGVDNNAASVGRSGMSKQSDDQQTEIVLSGFGSHVRDAVERTFDMLSEGRGEDINWSVGGMSTFHVTDTTTFVTNAVAAQNINIPSVTYHREIAKRTAQGQLPDIDEAIRQQINDEIEENVTEEMALKQAAMPTFVDDEVKQKDDIAGAKDIPVEGKAPEEDNEASV